MTAPTVAPTVGRTVLYKLSESDALAINVRRADFLAFQRSHPHPHEPGQPGATGHVAHVGNQARAGTEYPAVVVAVFDGTPAGTVNLKVQLDGNDDLWTTSRVEGDGPGQWRWPTFDPKATLQAISGRAGQPTAGGVAGGVADDTLAHWFTHHPPPDQATVEAYERIRAGGRQLAHLLNDLVPDSDEKTEVFKRLRDVVMWANAAVAIHGLPAGAPSPAEA